jgi:membrane associated rhomboid family serine protease
LGEVAGRNLFLIFYILTIGASSLLSYFKNQNNPGYSAIGASGGAAGLLFTYVLLDPWEKVYLYGVFGLPAIIFGVLYLGYETYLGKQNNDNIGHDAHISGAIFGFIFSAIVLKGVLVQFFEKLSTFSF